MIKWIRGVPSTEVLKVIQRRQYHALPNTIKQILASPCSDNATVAHGWIKNIRRQKHVAFVELSDGSTRDRLQVVMAPEAAQGLAFDCAVQASGQLVPSPGAGQTKELRASEVVLLGACPSDEYPLQKNQHGTTFARQHLHLRLRTEQMISVMHIRDAMRRLVTAFFRDHGFLRVEAPIITFGDCEGGGEVFALRPANADTAETGQAQQQSGEASRSIFAAPAYTTVSAQLHLEAFAAAHPRVYTLGPVFRAEASQTNRHLAEFSMLEAEVSFIDDLRQLMDLVEALVRAVGQGLEEDSTVASDLQTLRSRNDWPPDLVAGPLTNPGPWPRITYSTAIELLQGCSARQGWAPPAWGDDLQSVHEAWLAKEFARGPLFVTNYPTKLKPFYMRADSTDSRTVANFDLLVPDAGEIAGGSLREERLSLLEPKMAGMDPTAYAWYKDIRKFGSTPHGGFGIGWERLIAWLTGTSNVRECIPFPRSANVSPHC